LPLLSADGVAVGLVGVSQDLRLPDSRAQGFPNVLAAVSYAEDHIAMPPTVGQSPGSPRCRAFNLIVVCGA
jgi:hypothetical protein